MSDYHHNEFLGFGTCAPPNVLPNWFYKWLFFPPIKTEGGVPSLHHGLRKIEPNWHWKGLMRWWLIPTIWANILRMQKF